MHVSPGTRSNNNYTPMDSSPLRSYSSNNNHNATTTKSPNRDSPEPTLQPRIGRVRSNSRSSGSQYQNDLDQFDIMNNSPIPIAKTIIQDSYNVIEAPRLPKNHKRYTTTDSDHTLNGDAAINNNNNKPGNNNNTRTDNTSTPTNRHMGTIPPPSLTSRNKYTHIIILKSLNRTFETKFLMVPFKPDILKLGRPVVNTNNNNNNTSTGGKGNNTNNNSNNSIGNNNSSNENSKRNTNALVKPDNGNFDSRVLSRNHACLTCDPKTGKIFIKDLKSSNGTFINGNRIDQNEVELKVGDVIDLGTDIDTKFEHRKISAFVEEITIIPLINGLSPEDPGGNALGMNSNTKKQIIEPISVSPMSAQRAAFEAAMFGDVNNLDLEDAILGPETEILSGIFINNSIGTSPQLMNVIKTLSTELSLEKQEYAKLKSMETFMINYTTNLEYINKLMIEMNDRQLIQLQDTLKKTFSEKHERILQETKDQIVKMNKENDKLKQEYREQLKEDKNVISSLEMKIEDFKTRLEVEKYKNSQLSKKLTTKVVDPKPEFAKTDSSETTSLSRKNSRTRDEQRDVTSQDEIDSTAKDKSIEPVIGFMDDQSSTNSTDIMKENETTVKQGKEDTSNKKDNESNKNSLSKTSLSQIIIVTAISVGIIAVLLKGKFS